MIPARIYRIPLMHASGPFATVDVSITDRRLKIFPKAARLFMPERPIGGLCPHIRADCTGRTGHTAWVVPVVRAKGSLWELMGAYEHVLSRSIRDLTSK